MGKLIVELPDDLHGELKKKAAGDHATLKEIVTGLIQGYLNPAGKSGTAGKKTGLCGKWADDRTADEIILDIKSRRKWFSGRKN